MGVVLVSRDSVDLWKHEYIRDRLRARFDNIRVDIICGEYNAQKFTRPNVHYIYQGLSEYFGTHRNASKEEIINLQKSQAQILPSNTYKSDQMYFYESVKECELVLIQIYAVQQIFNLLQSLAPTLLFITGGSTIVRTVAFAVGEYLGIRCYRMHPTAFLNPKEEGWRYFFAPNNFYRMSEDERDLFDYPEDDVRNYATEFLNSVQRDAHQLDRVARSKGNDAIKAGVKGPPHHKQRAAKNYALNASLAADPATFPMPYFLFPLNTPADAQLLLRTPHFKDGLSICEQVANVLPYGYSLGIKEHPGYPGMLDHDRLRSLLKRYENVFYITGDVRLQSLLSSTAGLLVINSTSAIEAIAANVPVITLGEAFYRGSGLTFDVEYLLELQKILTMATAYDREPSTTYRMLHQLICRFLQQNVPEPSKLATDENSMDVIASGIIGKAEKFL